MVSDHHTSWMRSSRHWMNLYEFGSCLMVNHYKHLWSISVRVIYHQTTWIHMVTMISCLRKSNHWWYQHAQYTGHRHRPIAAPGAGHQHQNGMIRPNNSGFYPPVHQLHGLRENTRFILMIFPVEALFPVDFQGASTVIHKLSVWGFLLNIPLHQVWENMNGWKKEANQVIQTWSKVVIMAMDNRDPLGGYYR